MKTYIHIKSGSRYPEHGCVSWFTQWSNGKWEHHIKPGYPQCTNGWKKLKATEWLGEVIPDLPKPFTKQQWLDYAKQYGSACAQEFFDCCDYSKPSEASRMFLPPPINETLWNESEAWFQATFKRDLHCFMDAIQFHYGNEYSLDILKFEKHLASEFNYPMHKDGSIRDFLTVNFSNDIAEKVYNLL